MPTSVIAEGILTPNHTDLAIAGQLPKKLLHKEKSAKKIMQSDLRKRNREQINDRNCVAQKNCPAPEVKSLLFLEK